MQIVFFEGTTRPAALTLSVPNGGENKVDKECSNSNDFDDFHVLVLSISDFGKIAMGYKVIMPGLIQFIVCCSIVESTAAENDTGNKENEEGKRKYGDYRIKIVFTFDGFDCRNNVTDTKPSK